LEKNPAKTIVPVKRQKKRPGEMGPAFVE
jgi:hypothetical protein